MLWAEKHRGQARKGAQPTPYINHLLAVARLLAAVGGVEDHSTIIAAVLHDTIEDTDTTATELTTRFGAEVSGLVVEMSDDKALPKAERKRLQILHVPSASPRARLFKLADKLANVEELISDPPVGWSAKRRREFLDWSEAVVDRIRGTDTPLEARFDEAVARGRAALDVPRPSLGPEAV